MRANKFLAAAAVAAMAACGPQQVGTQYVAQVNATASQGGSLTVTSSQSAELAGLTLTIPAGALDKDTVITVELGDAALPSNSVAGSPALFGPSGLVFKKPARMTLPLKPGVNTSHLFIQGVEDNGTKFTVPHSAVTVSGSSVSFDVLGFTTFQPGLGLACTADSDCTGGQVCQNGSCVDLTVCSSDAQCPAGDYCLNGACAPANDGGMPDAGLTCTTDADCGARYACVSNQCVPVDNADAGVCVTDSDCASGQLCVNGSCQGPVDGGQPDGGITDGGQPDGGPSDGGLVCRSDLDCAAGQVCLNGQCTTGGSDAGQAPDAGVCITATDCSVGQLCVNGTCMSSSPDGGVCGAPTVNCGNVCVDITSDPANCGACSARCASGICSNGVCQ
jgi:Cys-rich repeat protein